MGARSQLRSKQQACLGSSLFVVLTPPCGSQPKTEGDNQTDGGTHQRGQPWTTRGEAGHRPDCDGNRGLVPRRDTRQLALLVPAGPARTGCIASIFAFRAVQSLVKVIIDTGQFDSWCAE